MTVPDLATWPCDDDSALLELIAKLLERVFIMRYGTRPWGQYRAIVQGGRVVTAEIVQTVKREN